MEAYKIFGKVCQFKAALAQNLPTFPPVEENESNKHLIRLL